MELGEERLYTCCYTVTTRIIQDCIKMGSDESHFNVSVGNDGQSQRTVSTNHNIFEQKGEPKRYRTEVLPLTSLTPYRWAKTAHNLSRANNKDKEESRKENMRW